MSYRVPVRNTKALTDSTLEVIKKILEESCVGEVCVRRSVIYEAVKQHITLDAEQYQFEQALTYAIKNNLLPGFETRSGRAGGICRAGAFSKRDEDRKSKQPPIKKQSYITVGKLTYKVPLTQDAARGFIVNILQATPTGAEQPDLFLNNEPFWFSKLTAKQLLENYISDSHGVEIEKSPEEDGT